MLAARFGTIDVFDQILYDLAKFSLLVPQNTNMSYVTGRIYTKTQQQDDQKDENDAEVEQLTQFKQRFRQINPVELCEEAVLKFSSSEKAQLAAKALFSIG